MGYIYNLSTILIISMRAYNVKFILYKTFSMLHYLLFQ